MQKFIISILILLTKTTSGFAQCYGTGAIFMLRLQQWESYNINRLGYAHMNGWNSNTEMEPE